MNVHTETPMPGADQRLLYRAKDIQQLLSIKHCLFWTLVKQGAFDARKIGRATVFTRESVERFVAGLPAAK